MSLICYAPPPYRSAKNSMLICQLRQVVFKAVASIAAIILACGVASATTEPIVNITPPTQTVTIGSFPEIAIEIAGISDLYAFQLSLSYDPSIVAAQTVIEGGFLPAGGTTIFIPGSINNMMGNITFIVDSLVGDIPGATGSGILSEITFEALAPGTTLITLSDALFWIPALTNRR
jgi:hypothetical protein